MSILSTLLRLATTRLLDVQVGSVVVIAAMVNRTFRSSMEVREAGCGLSAACTRCAGGRLLRLCPLPAWRRERTAGCCRAGLTLAAAPSLPTRCPEQVGVRVEEEDARTGARHHCCRCVACRRAAACRAAACCCVARHTVVMSCWLESGLQGVAPAQPGILRPCPSTTTGPFASVCAAAPTSPLWRWASVTRRARPGRAPCCRASCPPTGTRSRFTRRPRAGGRARHAQRAQQQRRAQQAAGRCCCWWWPWGVACARSPAARPCSEAPALSPMLLCLRPAASLAPQARRAPGGARAPAHLAGAGGPTPRRPSLRCVRQLGPSDVPSR